MDPPGSGLGGGAPPVHPRARSLTRPGSSPRAPLGGATSARRAPQPGPDRWALAAGLALALLAGRGVPLATVAPSPHDDPAAIRVEAPARSSLEASGAPADGIVFPGAPAHEVVEATLGPDAGRGAGAGARVALVSGALRLVPGSPLTVARRAAPLPHYLVLPAGFVPDRAHAPPA